MAIATILSETFKFIFSSCVPLLKSYRILKTNAAVTTVGYYSADSD